MLSENREHDVKYANMTAAGKYVSNKYLQTKLLHSAQFIIKTTSLCIIGQTISCL